MNKKNYVIQTVIGDHTRTQIWNSEKPIMLGQRLPWVVLQSKDGGLRLRHKSGQAWDINPDMVKEHSSIDLPKVEGESFEGIKFKIREIEAIEAPFERRKGITELPYGKWKVYQLSGDSVVESETFTGRYTGKHKGVRLFTLQERSGEYQLRLLDPTIQIERGIQAPEVSGADARNEYYLTPIELANLVIRYRTRQWRFNRVANVHPIPALINKFDADASRFRQSAAISAAVLLLMLLTSVLFTSSEDEEEEKKKVEVAKIIFKKKPKKQFTPPKSTPPKEEKKYARAPEKPKAPKVVKLAEKKTQKKPVRVAKKKPEKKKKEKARFKQVATAPKKVPVRAAKAPSAQPPKPLEVAKAPLARTPRPIKDASPLPKVGTRTSKKAAPKKKEALAVRRAQALKKSLGNLMSSGGMKSIIARGKYKRGRTRQKSGAGVLGATSKNLKGAGGGDADSPLTDAYSPQDVAVGYADGGGGKPGALSYRGPTQGVGRGGKAKKGGSFLDVGGAEDSPDTYVDSGLTRSEVFAVINRHMSEVRYCYETAILRRPDIEGKLMVNFTIGKRGRVTSSSIKASTLADTRLNRCVVQRLGKWKFPKPKGGSDVAVTYPFIFRRL